jgi:hypothetical protein
VPPASLKALSQSELRELRQLLDKVVAAAATHDVPATKVAAGTRPDWERSRYEKPRVSQ